MYTSVTVVIEFVYVGAVVVTGAGLSVNVDEVVADVGLVDAIVEIAVAVVVGMIAFAMCVVVFALLKMFL